MPRRGRSSSSENSPPCSHSARRRLPPPPTGGILRSRSSSRHVTSVDPSTLSRRVERIVNNLEDTNKNLLNVDSKVNGFKDMHDDSMSALSKLRNDLEGSLSKLRSEREKRSTTRNGYSLHQSDFLNGSERRRPASAVDFNHFGTARERGGANLHQSLRNIRYQVSDIANQQNEPSTGLPRANHMMRDVSGESAADRVERRLQRMENEITKERENTDKFASDAAHISRRSQAKLQEEAVLRNQLLQTESRKTALEGDLDAMRRRLEQSEGGKDALTAQIAELRGQLNQGERERAEMQQTLQKQIAREREEEERCVLSLSQRQNNDRRKQNEELSDLTNALRQSVGVVQLEDTRKNLEKSERQRQQLSDHIEVLTKDLEKKEQAQGRVLRQLSEVQQTAQSSQLEKDRLTMQLDNALSKLEEYKRETDKCVGDLRRYEQICDVAEKEKEDLRETSQDNLRQCKSKCKKLEKKCGRLQDNLDELNDKNEALLEETQASKSQANMAFQQCENLRNEMDNLISRRAEIEERLHRRDEELYRVQEEVATVTRNYEEAGNTIRKLEKDILMNANKNTALAEDGRRKDDDLISMRTLNENNHQHCNKLQAEIRELTRAKSQTQSKLEDEKLNHKMTVKKSEKINKHCGALKMELSSLQKHLDIEKESHKKEISKLQKQMQHVQAQHDDIMHKMNKTFNKEREFLESEIHRVNVEANESKAERRDNERKLNAANEKNKILEEKIVILHDEIKSIHTKYQEAQSSFDFKADEILKENNRLRRKEGELTEVTEKIKLLEGDIEIMQCSVNNDLDNLESAIFNKDDSFSRSTLDKSCRKPTFRLCEANQWCAKVRKILSTIKAELAERENKRKIQTIEFDQSKNEYKELCRKLEDDQITLMSEVSREKTSLLIENNEARMVVKDLQDRLMHNLTTDSEIRSTRYENTQNSVLQPEKLSPTLSNKNSQKEREKIQERYNKYKNTLELLESELKENRCSNLPDKSLRLNSSKTPSPIKKVTINDAPSVFGSKRIPKPLNSSSPKPTHDRNGMK